MGVLLCPCERKHKIWGELWWVGGKHDWVFYDDLETSKTYGENITHCPWVWQPARAQEPKGSWQPTRLGVDVSSTIGLLL
jgi:hypothetical protein